MSSPTNTVQRRRCSLAGAALLLAVLDASGCANKPGDDLECPKCDNTTEVLVGAKCVPLSQVEACGPDGHLHGSTCHCFGGQSPTTIGQGEYCLQQDCAGHVVDTDAQACDEVGQVAETVTAASNAAEVERAHLATATVAAVEFPPSEASFVHFEADEAGEFLVYVDTAGVLAAAQSEEGAALVASREGPNEDCASLLPEVWSIQVVAPGAVTLRFEPGTVPSAKVVVYESGHSHEEAQ